jgi:hypothetical protein
MLTQRINWHNESKRKRATFHLTATHDDRYLAAVPISQLTERRWRPFALLAEITFLPFLVDILSLNPCLFLLFLLLG